MKTHKRFGNKNSTMLEINSPPPFFHCASIHWKIMVYNLFSYGQEMAETLMMVRLRDSLFLTC